jgi:benzoyl-CoA reductase/2-hydroxyglutaryl-CoA dehydratase subunit BcrC/BadD/HgdB
MSGQNQIPIDLFSTAIGEFDDQLTKSFQVMANSSSKPFLDWEVPRFDPEARAWALDYLKKELKQFFTEMNILNGQHISGDSLRAAIRAGNLLRNDMTEIDAFLARDNVPLPGLEYYLVHVMLGDYSRDPAGLHERLRHLIDELKQRTNNHESAPGVSSTPVRIYIMGDETQELHLFNSIEAAGGVLVGCDFRMPLYYDLVDETNDPLDSMARWIWNMPNNLPLQERIKMELVKIKIQKPNAIILSNVVGSRRLPGVERLVKDIVKEEMGVPVLSIESTLPGENADKIDYQINALIQMIGG